MDFKLKKSDLNFRVYTASAVPGSGNENDIVIISDVPMKNWVMSPDAPKGAPRNDGDVWITYSVTGNTFNVLKNNTMLIATISAYQYVDGVWARVEAKNYQNGAWADWFPEGALYYNGAFAVPYVVTGPYSDHIGTCTLGDGYFLLKMRTAAYSTQVVTESPIDVTDYKTMTVDFDSLTPVGTNSEIKLFANDVGVEDTTLVKEAKLSNKASGTVTLDLSTLSGSYYLAVSIYHKSAVQEAKITNWRLNK